MVKRIVHTTVDVTLIKLYLLKRKLHFILQLLKNTSTAELLASGIHRTLTEVLDTIGIKVVHIGLRVDRYIGVIRSSVIKKTI